jgi:four helix bundle protein
MAIESYRDLRVWQEAMTLAEACYRVTSSLPREEMFGLTMQVRRAAVSVPANIAEGYGRNSKGAYGQFLRVAQGSLKELETHLLLTQRLGFAQETKIAPILSSCDSLGRMLRSLIRSIERSSKAT